MQRAQELGAESPAPQTLHEGKTLGSRPVCQPIIVENVVVDLYYEDAERAEEIWERIVSAPDEVEMVRRGSHPLQILSLLYTLNRSHGDDYDFYLFLKKHLHAIINDERFRFYQEHEKFHRMQQALPFPYCLDPRIAVPVYILNTVAGVRTLFSCQGVSDYITIDGVRIYIPDGHSKFAYILVEESERARDILLPFVEKYSETCNCVTITFAELGETPDRVLLESKSVPHNYKFCVALTEYLEKIFPKWRGE